MYYATACPLWGADRTVTCASGSLLTPGLLTATANFAAGLGLVRSSASCVSLGADDLVDQSNVGQSIEYFAGSSTVPTFSPSTPMMSTVFALAIYPSRTLHRGANQDNAVLRTRDGAANKEQALFLINCENGLVLDGTTDVTHAAGHALALENATRGRGAANGAGLAVDLVSTVRCLATSESVTLHNTGKSLALGVTGNVYLVAGFEHVRG